MVLSDEGVKWIELSRHTSKRKAFVITAEKMELNLNLNPDEEQTTAVHLLTHTVRVCTMYNLSPARVGVGNRLLRLSDILNMW
jgi:hypothetical protein